MRTSAWYHTSAPNVYPPRVANAVTVIFRPRWFSLASSSVLVLASMRGSANAGAIRATGEAGTEYDSNVQRVETGPDLDVPPIAAALLRFAARLDAVTDVSDWGQVSASATGQLRIPLDASTPDESLGSAGIDARWSRALVDQPVSVGAHVQGFDVCGLAGDVGARSFSQLAGEGMLSMRSEGGSVIGLSAGEKTFTYKPDADFNWQGPSLAAHFASQLWESPDTTRTLDLSMDYRLEARAYNSFSQINGCAPGATVLPSCIVTTNDQRNDLHHAVGALLTFTGAHVVSLGYELTVNTSSSFGQSLIRHRIVAAGTTELPGSLYATLTLTAQLDQYLDSLLVEPELQSSTFVTLDDENRSSVQLRVARHLTPTIGIELRASYWRNLNVERDGDFSRALVSAALVWQRD